MADSVVSAALQAWLDALETGAAPSEAQALAAAEAWVAMPGRGDALDAKAIARAVGGGLSEAERDALFADPDALLQIEAAEDFLDAVAVANAPPHLEEAAKALASGAQIMTFPQRAPSATLPVEAFRLRAAASPNRDKAILCRSESGVWVLEVFIDQSGDDRSGDRASILLSVDAECRASYEGRRAKVFVITGDTERVLAEADVRDGEVYAEVSLVGLDLHARDAISVVFSPTVADDAP